MEAAATKFRTRDIAYIAVFVALMAICSWISIPTAIPFTLQTMAIFLAAGLLGGRRGTLAVLAYILLGAVGAPGVPDHISLWDLLLTIRKGFDQYVNLRPVKLLSGAPCPLKGVKKEEVNMTFIRENSEGEYAGSGSWLYRGKPQEVVIQDGVFSRAGCERIIRYAFETARRERRSLTSVSKANALN